MSNTATALVRVEDSPVAHALNEQSQALLELLPDAGAVTRFKRVVLQAFAKNPDLLACTPDSVITSVFEAAAMGLEPTGSVGGAHLVPFNVNVGTQQSPKWEKRAQLIPDFRGVVAMVTRPAKDGTPSEVVAIEARTVKEGDEFRYTLGVDSELVHVPTLSASRSSKPTTHVYAIARLRSGATQTDVMDHAEVERIRQRGKEKRNSPWNTDWDEMAKKTVVKRLAKLVPVRPEVRSILAREDEIEDPAPAPAVELPAAAPATSRLAARLRPQPAPAPVAAPAAEEPVEAAFTAIDGFDDAPGASAALALSGEAFPEYLREHGVTDGAVVRAVKEELFGDRTSLDDEERGRLAIAVVQRVGEARA